MLSSCRHFCSLTKLEDFSELESGCGFTYDLSCGPKKIHASGCNWDLEGVAPALLSVVVCARLIVQVVWCNTVTAWLPGSMFFLMTVGTTIGYGSYTPQTLGGQVYVVMYAITPAQSLYQKHHNSPN